MVKHMLFFTGLMLLGGSQEVGASQLSRGGAWLMGFGSTIEAAVELASRGIQNPSAISDSEIENAISGLAGVAEQLETRLDQCLANQIKRDICQLPVESKMADFQRRVTNSKALIVFFRNLLIVQAKKPKSERNFKLAYRLGRKIKQYSSSRLSS